MPRPVNAKGKPFSWSFSAVNDFITCPFQYAHRRFYCTLPYIETEAIKWGNRVHTAAEKFLKRIPHNDPEALAPVEPYTTVMLRSGLDCVAEMEIALSENFEKVKWFSNAAWLRVKIDVTLLNRMRSKANVYDWKTGNSIKDDEAQLRLSCAALHKVIPSLEEFDGKYVWTAHKEVTGMRPLTAADIPYIWEEFLAKVKLMERAWETETFPQRPCGLCKKWCKVTQCPHQG